MLFIIGVLKDICLISFWLCAAIVITTVLFGLIRGVIKGLVGVFEEDDEY